MPVSVGEALSVLLLVPPVDAVPSRGGLIHSASGSAYTEAMLI